MESIHTNSERNLLSFAATRPSRTSQVVSDEHALEMRRVCEQAWFAEAGVDPEALKMYGVGRTGSPTGSKAPHQLDDYIEDFGPISE